MRLVDAPEASLGSDDAGTASATAMAGAEAREGGAGGSDLGFAALMFVDTRTGGFGGGLTESGATSSSPSSTGSAAVGREGKGGGCSSSIAASAVD